MEQASASITATTGTRWMTRAQTAAALGLHVNNLSRLIRAGVLPPPVYISVRRPRFDAAEVDAAVRRMGNTGAGRQGKPP